MELAVVIIGINIMRLRQNGLHFPDNIFKCIFLNEKLWISIKISMKAVPKGHIYNIPASVRILAWCQPSNEPLAEPMMVNLLMHICITQPQWVNSNPFSCSSYVSLLRQLSCGFNELAWRRGRWKDERSFGRYKDGSSAVSAGDATDGYTIDTKRMLVAGNEWKAAFM